MNESDNGVKAAHNSMCVAHDRCHDHLCHWELDLAAEPGLGQAAQGSFYAVEKPSKADLRGRKTRASEAQVLRGPKRVVQLGPGEQCSSQACYLHCLLVPLIAARANGSDGVALCTYPISSQPQR